LVWEDCDTVYDVDRSVECYERLKTRGPTGAAVFQPQGTHIISALTERATHDQIPLITLGIGHSAAADGRVFPYVFPAPINFWSQNTAKIRFLGQRAGGMHQLKGRKIAHVYHDSEYGRETLPILDAQAAQYGFAVQHLPVPPPGLDQKATWLRVKVAQPDWVILRTAGVMTRTALKEAALVAFPREKIVGPQAACAEQEIVPAGEAAIGLICANWHGTGTHFPLIQEVRRYVYARGKGAGPERDVGTGPWTRGMLRGLLTAEGCARPCATSATSP
jgi:branched-chain amino acid transport system substrate-binding protein